MEKISFVIPALNGGKSIGSVVGQLVDEFPDAEILVVDDGSDTKLKRRS